VKRKKHKRDECKNKIEAFVLLLMPLINSPRHHAHYPFLAALARPFHAMLIPHMPPPILLPRKPSSSHPCIFAFSECAEKALGSDMDIIDMTIDVFSRFKAAIALWASFRVGVGFEMTANSTVERGFPSSLFLENFFFIRFLSSL